MPEEPGQEAVTEFWTNQSFVAAYDQNSTRLRSGSYPPDSELPDWHLGNTVALADSAGALQTLYAYEPFGGTSSTGPSTSSNFMYAGRENDGTGLYCYRARSLLKMSRAALRTDETKAYWLRG